MLGSFVLINFVINHFYGTETVGIYALSYSISQIGILGVGSVFSMLMRRDLSLGEHSARPYLAKVQILRSANLGLVLLLAAAGIFLFYPALTGNLNFVLMMICAKGFDALSESYYTAYQTLDRLGEYSTFKILNAVSLIAVSLFVCINSYDIQYLYLSQVGCAFVMFAVNFLRWQRPNNPVAVQIADAGPSYRFLLIESYPLMINAMIFQLSVRANNILIFDKLGEKDLGMFSLVVITVGIFAGVANTLAIVFFGRLTRTFANDRENFNRRLHQSIGAFLALGIAFFFLYLLFTPIIENFFSLSIDHDLYRIMSAAIPFMFVTSCLGSVFTIMKKQKVGMYLSAVILMANLSAYYLLSQKFGLVGAGYAFLVTAAFQCTAFYLVMRLTLRSILKSDPGVKSQSNHGNVNA